jgi:hypothetical protein
MNLRHYLLSNVCRSPDEPTGAAEPEVIEVAPVEPAAEVVAEAEVVEPEATAVEEKPEPAASDHGNKGKTPWYMGRINEETNRRNAEAARAAAAEAERDNYRAMLERLLRPRQRS